MENQKEPSLLRSLIRKFLCLHDWYVHNKTQSEYDHIFNGSKYKKTENTDVFVCHKCGKIKIINY